MSVDSLRNALPAYAKDLSLNLSSLMNETVLSEQQKWGCFIACAYAVGTGTVIRELQDGCPLSAEALTAAKAAAADIDEAEPLFQAIGRKTFRVGDKQSAANLVKLCGNFAILAAIETMGEAMALAEKGGVPKATLLEVLTGTLFDTPVYKTYGAMIVENRFTPAGFKAPLGLKDMRLAGQAAERYRVAMPLLGVLRDHLLETIAKEGEDIDWAGIGRTIGKNAGLMS